MNEESMSNDPELSDSLAATDHSDSVHDSLTQAHSEHSMEIERLKLEQQTMSKEVEELTKSLFEEANRLVADARQQTFDAERKALFLQKQLEEMQERYHNESEQLKELKSKWHEQKHHANVVEGSDFWEFVAAADKAQELVWPEKTFHPGSVELGNKRLSSSWLSAQWNPSLMEEFMSWAKRPLPQSTSRDASPASQRSVVLYSDEANGRQKHSLSSLFQSRKSRQYQQFSLQDAVDACTLEFLETNPSRFVRRILDEDLLPALSFHRKDSKSFRKQLLHEIAKGSITLEKKTGESPSCDLCGHNIDTVSELSEESLETTPLDCFSLVLEDSTYTIDAACRHRIVAVCDWFSFIKYFSSGFFDRLSDDKLYAKMCLYRRHLFYSRLGAYPYFLFYDWNAVQH